MLNLFKKKTKFGNSAQAVGAVETLINAKLLTININTYHVYIDRSLCWDGKTKKWQDATLTNFHLYIGLKRALQKHDHKPIPMKVYDLNTKELITEKRFEE